VISPLALERERLRALGAVSDALPIAHWPHVPITWNRRLRRAGRALIEGHGRTFSAARIQLSPVYFEVYPADLYGILVHEAVHVALAVLGRPIGHGPDFRRACLEAGGLLHGRALPGRLFRYRCPVCSAVLERRRRIAEDRWCASCVERAADRGENAYASDRALVLVGTSFCGPEHVRRAPAAALV
jgi:predicted SprT family Zn-dependent metalloprotease